METELSSRSLGNGVIHLLKLFKFNDYNNHSYYGAVMKSELGPGHYMAYCGTTNIHNGFCGLSDMEADRFAGFLRSLDGQKIGYFGNGVTFSELSLLEEVALGAWWIGTDYARHGKVGGSYTTAIDGCEDLYSLMVKASNPLMVNAAFDKMEKEPYTWH